MSKGWNTTSKVIKKHVRDGETKGLPDKILLPNFSNIMTADMIVPVSCPACEKTQRIDLELTDNVFAWKCAFCNSVIESTVVSPPDNQPKRRE